MVCFFVPCCGKLNGHDSCILINYLSSAFSTIFVIMQAIVLPLKVTNVRGRLWHSCCGVFLLTSAGKVSEGRIKAMDKQFCRVKFMKILETITSW